ncbi:hypothetical protein [Deinococcus sp. PEB2-63]
MIKSTGARVSISSDGKNWHPLHLGGPDWTGKQPLPPRRYTQVQPCAHPASVAKVRR